MISASSTDRPVGALTGEHLPAPTVADLSVQPVSNGVWRVSDTRLPEQDALCVLGVIEVIDGRYEALAVGRGLKRSAFPSLEEAIPFFARN